MIKITRQRTRTADIAKIPATAMCHGCTRTYAGPGSTAEHKAAFCSLECEEGYCSDVVRQMRRDGALLARVVDCIMNKCTPE